jgi:glycosyltransferase involved in cell wall biosynthesis
MRILHVLAPAEFGGLEAVVLALAAGHRARGHDVHVLPIIIDAAANHPFVARLEEHGLQFEPLRIGRRAYLRERSLFKSLCESVRPDIVHTHGYRPDVLAAGVARRLSIPTVSTIHGFTGGHAKNRLYEWLQRRALRRFDAVVVVSQAQYEMLRHSHARPGRLFLVRNAWYPAGDAEPREVARAKLDVPDDVVHIGWVGRMSREKGVDIALDALARLRDLTLTASFIGEGPELPAARARAASLGLGHRVVWQGVIHRAGRLFSAFDVLLLTSRTEGTPIVLFEGMAAGVPVVATRVGGVPEVISEGEAWLVPAADPDAIAAAVRDILRDRAAAGRRVRAALARLGAEFGHSQWLTTYERVYDIARRKTGALNFATT